MGDTLAEISAYERATAAADALRSLLPPSLQRPHVAVVCGSGLGGLQTTIDESPRLIVPYAEIPHFPKSTVEGHEGKMVFGMMNSKVPVVMLVGRAHFYEGHTMDAVTFAARVCKRLEVNTVIVTNAAGGINPSYSVGDIVMLSDHINLAGLAGIHPLRGPNEDAFGLRFLPLSDAYDLHLKRKAHRVWAKLSSSANVTKTVDGISKPPRRLHEGVYAFVGGPTYETRAEIRMLHMLGADVVGMSTIPEVIIARHAGIKVLAFSIVTNNAVLEPAPRGDDPSLADLSDKDLSEYLSKGKANHQEVLAEGLGAAETMQTLVKLIIEDLDDA